MRKVAGSRTFKGTRLPRGVTHKDVMRHIGSMNPRLRRALRNGTYSIPNLLKAVQLAKQVSSIVRQQTGEGAPRRIILKGRR